MDQIIKVVAITDLLVSNILRNHHSGLVSGRAVQQQPQSLLDHCTDIMDTSHTIYIIYLDFKKAFDLVIHILPLSKLHGFSIPFNSNSYGFCDTIPG